MYHLPQARPWVYTAFLLSSLLIPAYGGSASASTPAEETPQEIQEISLHKSGISLLETALLTGKLPSKSIITPITSAFHGGALAFIAWTALMALEAFCKNVKGKSTNELIYVYVLLLGSMGLGSGLGYASGLIYQRWGAHRWYGLPLRNGISALGALLIAGLNSCVLKGWFQEEPQCTYLDKNDQVRHLFMALVGFLVITELLRSWRAHGRKAFSAAPTRRDTLGRVVLMGGGVGALAFIFSVLVGSIDDYGDKKIILPLFLVSAILIYGTLALLAKGLDKWIWRATPYKKKGVMHFGALVICFVIFMFIQQTDLFLAFFLPALHGLLCDMGLTELAHTYYVGLLLRQGAVEVHSQKRAKKPEEDREARSRG